uniref:(northern house mosquito) hypothetical protein n=1 Tax=Culex pipiens TaxID=7175 RepID=A0A8D8JY44_CULPI
MNGSIMHLPTVKLMPSTASRCWNVTKNITPTRLSVPGELPVVQRLTRSCKIPTTTGRSSLLCPVFSCILRRNTCKESRRRMFHKTNLLSSVASSQSLKITFSSLWMQMRSSFYMISLLHI